MLRGLYSRQAHEADTEADPQGGASGKVRASDLRQQLGTQVDEQALMRLLEKQAELLSDNSQLREQRRTLRQEVTDLKTKVPAADARMLTPEEAATYDAYAALGMKPADVKAAITERDTVKADLTTVRRNETIRGAAEAHGYKAAALAKLPSLRDQDIAIEDVTVDGKPVKRAFVTADGKKTALPDYIQAHDAEFLPALATDTTISRGDGVGSPAGGKKPAGGESQVRSPGIVI
jgi:hypothetical protein